MKTFEEVPPGTLFARQDGQFLDHEPYEMYIKLRDSFRRDLPDGSGFMNVNAIKVKNGSPRSINLREPVKRVGILLGIRTLFTALGFGIKE